MKEESEKKQDSPEPQTCLGRKETSLGSKTGQNLDETKSSSEEETISEDCTITLCCHPCLEPNYGRKRCLPSLEFVNAP